MSTGTGFGTPSVWVNWADADWDYFALGTRIPSPHTRPAIFGLLDGEWYVGLVNTGTSYFGGGPFTRWANLAYDEVRTLDINGDGQTDVAGLVDGEWHVGIALNNHANWVTWADVAWQDVRVGDFDGDGRDDLAGRAGGQWWVTTSDADGVVSTDLVGDMERSRLAGCDDRRLRR